MHVVIIGNGVAGITTARHIRKQDTQARITVISGETDHFYSRTALMYIFMGHMQFEHTKPYEDWFWEKNRIELRRAWVNSVDFEQQCLHLEGNETLQYDKLVLATGSKSNKFGWPGQDLHGVQGLYNYQDLEQLEVLSQSTRRAVIVGGGLIGIELAEMLLSRGIAVTFLVREDSFWNIVLPAGESAMINRHILEHHVDLQLNTELKTILPDENGRCTAVETSNGETIDCQFVGLTAGVSPNIDFLRDSALKTDRGILVNHQLQTNMPNVYACGDCAQFEQPLPGRRPIEQVWYTGKLQGQVVANNICGNAQAYAPGPWFNSAKFFDIEYQTYGTVLAPIQEGEQRVYWEHPDGKICLHLVFHKDSHEFIGLNSFGMRWRHEFFDAALRQKKSIQFVLEHLRSANFDPELFDKHEPAIVEHFNRETGMNISLAAKQSFFQKLFN